MMNKIFTFLLFFASISIRANSLPNRVDLSYASSYGIPAKMMFMQNSNQYLINVAISIPFNEIIFQSHGYIKNNKFITKRYIDKRNNQVYALAQFSSDNITYGKSSTLKTENISTPAYDYFSFAWQLSLDNKNLPKNFILTNGKKIYSASDIKFIDKGTFSYKNKNYIIERYVVETGTDSIIYSISPELNNIPVEIIYKSDSKIFNIKLTELKINGKVITPN